MLTAADLGNFLTRAEYVSHPGCAHRYPKRDHPLLSCAYFEYIAPPPPKLSCACHPDTHAHLTSHRLPHPLRRQRRHPFQVSSSLSHFSCPPNSLSSTPFLRLPSCAYLRVTFPMLLFRATPSSGRPCDPSLCPPYAAQMGEGYYGESRLEQGLQRDARRVGTSVLPRRKKGASVSKDPDHVLQKASAGEVR